MVICYIAVFTVSGKKKISVELHFSTFYLNYSRHGLRLKRGSILFSLELEFLIYGITCSFKHFEKKESNCTCPVQAK